MELQLLNKAGIECNNIWDLNSPIEPALVEQSQQ